MELRVLGIIIFILAILFLVIGWRGAKSGIMISPYDWRKGFGEEGLIKEKYLWIKGKMAKFYGWSMVLFGVAMMIISMKLLFF